MSVLHLTDLEELGLSTAQEVAGPDAVKDVEVKPGEDLSDRPVYFFSFLIDQTRARERPGLVRIHLAQRLRDELMARGDERRPRIRILDEADWNKRTDAGLY